MFLFVSSSLFSSSNQQMIIPIQIFLFLFFFFGRKLAAIFLKCQCSSLFFISRNPLRRAHITSPPFIDSHFTISTAIQTRRQNVDMGVLRHLRTKKSRVVATKVSPYQLISLLKTFASVPHGSLLINLGLIPLSGDVVPFAGDVDNKLTPNCFVHGYQAAFVAGTMLATNFTYEYFSNILKVDEDVTPVQHACQVALSHAETRFRHPMKRKNVHVFHVTFEKTGQEKDGDDPVCRFCVVVQRCRHKTCVLSVSDVSPTVLLHRFRNINELKERLCKILGKKLVPENLLRDEVVNMYGKPASSQTPAGRLKNSKFFLTK